MPLRMPNPRFGIFAPNPVPPSFNKLLAVSMVKANGAVTAELSQRKAVQMRPETGVLLVCFLPHPIMAKLKSTFHLSAAIRMAMEMTPPINTARLIPNASPQYFDPD